MITLSDLRSRLKLDPSRDNELQDIKEEVVSLWEEVTKRSWEYQIGYEQLFENDDRGRDEYVFLDLYPVHTITKVETRTKFETSFTTLDADKYELVDFRSLRRMAQWWPKYVKVTYNGGYLGDPKSGESKTPADVKRALLVQAEYMQARQAEDKLLVRSQRFENFSTTYEDGAYHPYFRKLARERVKK